MHRRPGAALLPILLLLAACGGAGGGGSGGEVAGESAASQDAAMEGSREQGNFPNYGRWNAAISTWLWSFGRCNDRCGVWFPREPESVASPFPDENGEPATFDPSTDVWAATWSGDAEGYRYLDPDGTGPAGKYWTGTFNLRIDAANPSRVLVWGEDLFYRRAADRDMATTVAVDDDEIPDSRSDAWHATLSTNPGEKGYFKGDVPPADPNDPPENFAGLGIRGQFLPPGVGTTPLSAIGHVRTENHTGVFEVTQ